MAEQRLFADQQRDDPDPQRAAETSFRFLQRVDDPVFERVRAVFNEWFARFANRQGDEPANDLRGRFRSRQDDQFYAAFWELYLHEVLARLGFEVEVHPEGPKATRPDFVVRRDGKTAFYLEAVMPTPRTGEEPQPGSVATVLEYVDAAFNADFFVAVRFVAAGAQTPKRKDVVRIVERWLAPLRWEDYRSERGIHGRGPEAELSIGDWVIGLMAIPRSPEARGDRSFPTVGMYPAMSVWVESVIGAIGPTLDGKASKYGDLDAPCVIAAWVMSAAAREGSLAQALFGVALPVEPGRHPIVMPQDRFGLWTPNRQRRERVSAVLMAGSFDFNYSAVARTMPRFWPNPWASRPIDAALPFPTSRVYSDETTVENTRASLTASELIGLPYDWPGVPFQHR